MLTIYVQNIKTIQDIADYEYIVMVNAEKIAEGTVTGHKRKDGWVPLVKRICDQNEDGNETANLRTEVVSLKTRLEEADKLATALRYDRNYWRDEHGKGGNQ